VKKISANLWHVSRSRKSYVLSIGLLVRSITRQKICSSMPATGLGGVSEGVLEHLEEAYAKLP